MFEKMLKGEEGQKLNKVEPETLKKQVIKSEMLKVLERGFQAANRNRKIQEMEDELYSTCEKKGSREECRKKATERCTEKIDDDL